MELTEVPKTKRPYRYHESWRFTSGDVRAAFERVYAADENYVLFMTIANEKAAELLEKYIGSMERDGDREWEVREYKKEEQLDPNKYNRRFQFSNELMRTYRRAIDKLADTIIGKENYAHYPIVSTNGVHDLQRDPKAVYWPEVYIVKQKNHNDLKSIIDSIHSNWGILQEIEAPQNNHMGEIKILYTEHITAIKRQEKEWTIGIDELTIAVDFLSQMEESYRWTGPVECIDD